MATEDSIYGVVVGTAGHIDHGKSSLVRRLTGVDPDRLPEEKDRGLTIDLGFAPMKLPGGELVGIIDVPGHEKFIRNMVAGASGIDLVVLVVAADDSVMPQTLEHLSIMTILGVKRGIIAINKIEPPDRGNIFDVTHDDVPECCCKAAVSVSDDWVWIGGNSIVVSSSETGCRQFPMEEEDVPGSGCSVGFEVSGKRRQLWSWNALCHPGIVDKRR